MKRIVMANHMVANYSEWRPKFDAHEAIRREHGVRLIDVLTDAGNENNVTLLLEVADMEKLNALFSSEEFQKATMEAGVISEPEVKIFISKN